MQNSKQQALMFLLGAVLVGGALGFTADRMMIRDKLCTAEAQDMRAVLSERLALTPVQERVVDSILDDKHKRYEIIMAPLQESLDSVKLRARAQIRLVLAGDQMQKFDQLVREMNDSTKSRDRE